MIVRSILPRTTPRSFPRITARGSTRLAYPLTRSTSSPRLRPLSRTCERAVTHVYLLANARVTAYLRGALPKLELTADPKACEALIVTYDTELTYDKLRDAALLLQQNPV